MTTLQQYLGRFDLSTSMDNMSVGADAIALTAGKYYICGYTGESTSQLCEHLQTKIRAIGASQDASTVAYSEITGLITITLETAATLTFTDAALGLLLGFHDASQTSKTTHVADHPPRYVWRPTEGLATYPLALSAWWGKRSTTIGGRGPDGTTYTVKGNMLYQGKYGYQLLPKSDVMIDSDTLMWESFEQFWTDVIAEGEPIRCYPDRTLKSSADVFEGVVTKEEVGDFEEWASRHIETYDGLWNVNFELSKRLT